MTSMYRMRSGSWQPARLKRVDYQVILVMLVVIAYVRGFDYLLGNDRWTAKDFMLAAAPEWVWGGVGFVAGAVILAAGLVRRRHLLVYVGHGWLGTAYTVNSLALALGSNLPWLDGVRGAGSVGLVAVVHWVYCLRTGSSPLRVIGPEGITSTEHIVQERDQ